MAILNLTNKELTVIIRALSSYGEDAAKNGANTQEVLSLLCEFSHILEDEE